MEKIDNLRTQQKTKIHNKKPNGKSRTEKCNLKLTTTSEIEQTSLKADWTCRRQDY